MVGMKPGCSWRIYFKALQTVKVNQVTTAAGLIQYAVSLLSHHQGTTESLFGLLSVGTRVRPEHSHLAKPTVPKVEMVYFNLT